MGQPSTLKYYKKLVYYVISLVVTMNNMVESNDFARVGEMTNNIIDQLFFLQDVLNIQVACVNEYLKDVLMKDFFIRYCYEVINPTNSTPLIQLRTSLFLLSSVLNAMKEISLFPCPIFLHNTLISRSISSPSSFQRMIISQRPIMYRYRVLLERWHVECLRSISLLQRMVPILRVLR